ncbi:MAG: sigma 54-interacting transcriptional regulator [Candidatus Latescibacterota bacterium]
MADGLIKVVAVSQNVSLSRRLARLWPEDQVYVAWEPDLDCVLERFENESFDVLLVTSASFRQGRVNGIELLDVLGVKSMATQVLFLAPEQDIKVAMSALKAGSFHYVRTPVGDTELKLMIETAFAQRPTYGSNQLLKRAVAFEASSELVGNSQEMLEVVAHIQQAASTDIPVLIQGETGTGKDLVAQAIHRQSERNGAPFVPVNNESAQNLHSS